MRVPMLGLMLALAFLSLGLGAGKGRTPTDHEAAAIAAARAAGDLDEPTNSRWGCDRHPTHDPYSEPEPAPAP